MPWTMTRHFTAEGEEDAERRTRRRFGRKSLFLTLLFSALSAVKY
jgi:hypothetical protein